MKKSNSKALYKFSKRQKAKENLPPQQEDSLDQIPLQQSIIKSKRKPTHLRSQSCPFEGQGLIEGLSGSKQKESAGSQFCAVSTSAWKKKPSHQHSTSQISLGSNTVIIREIPLQQLSSVLFRKSGNIHRGQLIKKGVMSLKGQNYARTRAWQQMRSYQLRKQLQTVQKQSQSTSIKQRILQNLLMRFQGEMLENSFDFE